MVSKHQHETGLLYVILQGNEDKLRDVEFAPKLGELREKFGDTVIHELQNLGYEFTAGIGIDCRLDWVVNRIMKQIQWADVASDTGHARLRTLLYIIRGEPCQVHYGCQPKGGW